MPTGTQRLIVDARGPAGAAPLRVGRRRTPKRTAVLVLAAIGTQAIVFFGTPELNAIYDGWPRGWLVLTTAVAWAFCGGIVPGSSALAAGVWLIWWRGAYFIPMHPGLEVLTAIGVFHILVIHRLQVTRRALMEEQEAFAKSFHGNAAGMAITRLRDAIVIDVNDAYLRISGYERAELVGRPVTALWKSHEEREHLIERVTQHGGVENYETAIVRKTGEEWPVLVSAQVIELSGEQAIVSSIQSITALKSLELDLREASAAKDRFLASLSHELRTPLNVVLGYARMARTTSLELPPKIVKMLEAVERNAVAQLRIIEDLLDAQRISSGKLVLETSTVDLKKLEETVVDALHPLAAAKGIHYFIDFDPIVTRGDGARLQQVFWNLLSNAIKFTPHNGCIGVYGKTENDKIAIKVVDSGEGIPEHFLPHVFERFSQLDDSTTRRHSGVGLGLAIAREIVELHGGEILAHSEGSGRGATFTVLLPWIRPGG